MSDSSKYVNTYIEVAVGTVHELLNQVLQLKTEARISSDLVSERDQVISSLQTEKDQISDSLTQERERIAAEHAAADQATQQARVWEGEVNTLRSKADNYDALSNQFNEIKRDFITKQKELENVKKELEETKIKLKELEKIERQVKKEEKKSQQIVAPKPIINKETTPVAKPVTVAAKVVVPPKVEETDDF